MIFFLIHACLWGFSKLSSHFTNILRLCVVYRPSDWRGYLSSFIFPSGYLLARTHFIAFEVYVVVLKIFIFLSQIIMPDEKDEKPSKAAAGKAESSTRSSNPLVRLPSFRQPRDLTLGSGSVRGGALGLGANKSRKNYAPNLNVQRNKVKE